MADPKDGSRQETDSRDDVEILEIVGLDEDAPPGSGKEPDDIELVFEEEVVPIDAAVDPAPAVARERFLRLQADFDNYRKRAERERDDHARYAASDIVARLLPVLDNLDLALAAARTRGGEDGLHAGVDLIHRQLLEELRRDGLRPMVTVGEPFDPELHEAAATDRSGARPPNTVVEDLRRGYFFHDRVLRPALVKVSVDPSNPVGAEDRERES